MDRLLSAPDPLVHSVLVALCDDDRVQARALRYLAELQSYAAQLASAGAGASSPSDSAGGGGAGAVAAAVTNPRKRKALASEPGQLGMQLCIQCKHAFTPADNSDKACFYHDGELELLEDHALWADWDEAVGGPHDSLENQEDHPEAFAWTCCDKDGTRSGCTKGYHVAVRKNHFKRFQMYPPHETDGNMSRVFEGRLLKANEFVNESLSPNRAGGYSSMQAWGLTGDDSSDRTGRDSEGESEGVVGEDL